MVELTPADPVRTMSSAVAIGGEPQWLPLPDVLGNLVTVSAAAPADAPALVLAAEFDRRPSGGTLAANLISFSAELGPHVPLEKHGEGVSASLRIPVGYQLVRLCVKPTEPGTAMTLQQVSVERTAFNPTGRDILVNLSVDVEALPHRAPSDHVDRLIYGRFDGGEYGVPAQLRMFRELGIPATFYLECGQSALYGEDAIAGAGKMILDAGFDLQLHLHSEILINGGKWPWNRSLSPQLQNLDRNWTRRAYSYAAERYEKIAGKPAEVFRAGGYQFNPSTLEIGAALGLKAHSNFRADQPQNNTYSFDRPGPFVPFRWTNGLYEFPITVSPEPLVNGPEDCWKRILTQVQTNETWLVNIVIHSWSLLRRNAEDGFQVYGGQELAENLRKIIEHAPEGVRFVQITDVVNALERGELGVAAIMDPVDLIRGK